ncbi:MAG: serine/threonine protein kinase [Candidatus Hydrogenedentes bacterium]|nr:serine/threonine protein kinase [Candidatus Hydrogenedentota bacterium]
MAATIKSEWVFEADCRAEAAVHGLSSADGRFVLQAKLGDGGHGRVYRALDTKYARQVALKFAPRGNGHGWRAVRREVDVRRKLHDRSCVVAALGLYEVAWAARQFVAVSLEFVPAGTLRDWLKRHEASHGYRLEKGLQLFAGLCDSVAVFHAQGFLHLDLKPANVLLTASSPVLCDLASSISLRHEKNVKESPSHRVYSTPAYTAPELWRGEDPQRVGARADCYALGCIGYEIFSRECRPPFSGGADRQRTGHLFETPARLGGVPEHIRRVIQRCLEK